MSKLLSSTLGRYLSSLYVLNFIGLYAGLLCIVYLFDTVELLRRAAKFEDLPLLLVLQMGLLKLPEVGQILLPFAILFSAMFTFWQLSKREELTILRSSGLSAWQFLMPIMAAAFLIGLFQIFVINPMGALFLKKFETLEIQYLERQEQQIALSDQGLWLKQKHGEGNVVLHASEVELPAWILKNVMVLFFEGNNDFAKRIDASQAVLEPGQWTFKEATINAKRELPQKLDLVSLETHLTATEIEESFASAETIPFWQLQTYIKTMQATGFDPTRLRIYFQSLLSQPLFFIAMILLAASVSLRPARVRGAFILIVAGVFIGFVVFFFSNFIQALGVSGQIPVIIAAWFPAIICFLLGIGAMMTLEDG